ncbi:hypothetical protein T484DRAFT_1788489 [Baffinella frigidus]|nr:hypothetical protein T484DRAFT_1788489 [Cryptophyta sp. CCMP2293]
MDQELVSLLKCPDKESAAKGARMLASFLAKASSPAKAVLALREVIPPEALQRIVTALSQRLLEEQDELEALGALMHILQCEETRATVLSVEQALGALMHILQCEEAREAVLSVGDVGLVELCKDLIAGLSRAVRLESVAIGIAAVAVFGSVCQSDKARQLLLQHSDTEPIFEKIPGLLTASASASGGGAEGVSIPLAIAHITRIR